MSDALNAAVRELGAANHEWESADTEERRLTEALEQATIRRREASNRLSLARESLNHVALMTDHANRDTLPLAEHIL